LPDDDAPQRRFVDEMRRLLGERYADIRLANWSWSPEPSERRRQEQVIGFLRKSTGFLSDDDRPTLDGLGGNVIFVGPPGTGKDMLMGWLVRVAVSQAKTVEWFNGPNLFGRTREMIRDDASESDFLKRLRHLDVLCLSDPFPPGGGKLSDAQVSWLYRIVDERYRAMRPIFATVNVSNQKEGEDRLTPQVWDRLIDGASLVLCSWKSFRKQQEVVGA
jgi:DNA replication protein DnaC